MWRQCVSGCPRCPRPFRQALFAAAVLPAPWPDGQVCTAQCGTGVPRPLLSASPGLGFRHLGVTKLSLGARGFGGAVLYREASRPGCSGTVASPARGSAEAAPRVSGPRRRPMGPHALPPPPPPLPPPRLPRAAAPRPRPRPREAGIPGVPARRVPAAATSRAAAGARTGRAALAPSAARWGSAMDVGGDSLPLVDARAELPSWVTGTGGGDSPAGMTGWAGIPQARTPAGRVPAGEFGAWLASRGNLSILGRRMGRNGSSGLQMAGLGAVGGQKRELGDWKWQLYSLRGTEKNAKRSII